MRYVREELGANQHPRYMFALGKEEAKIIYGALLNARKWTPNIKSFGMSATRARIQNMLKIIRETLPTVEEDIT